MNVGMTAVAAVNRLVDDAESGRRGLAETRAELDAVEHRPPEYGRWLVVVALGLTAASLSRLFGGDWPTFAVTWLAGATGTWLRQELGRHHFNAIVIPFAAASLSGIIGGGGVLLGTSGTPSLCLVAPGMIIVPGVPLINGVQDMIRNHMTLGISRLGFAFLVTTAIAFGLFVATVVTGVTIPVNEPARAIGIPQDAVFSALAALGYAFLFNVPARVAWACVLCGVASHTTRTLSVHLADPRIDRAGHQRHAARLRRIGILGHDRDRGEHRDAGLAHSDDVHAGAKHLQKRDDVIDKLVEAEPAVPQADVAGVVPV